MYFSINDSEDFFSSEEKGIGIAVYAGETELCTEVYLALGRETFEKKIELVTSEVSTIRNVLYRL